jgi:hypothetical protein
MSPILNRGEENNGSEGASSEPSQVIQNWLRRPQAPMTPVADPPYRFELIRQAAA